jgi:carboxypeptidase family protein/TonB-dependent receptor-like protein
MNLHLERATMSPLLRSLLSRFAFPSAIVLVLVGSIAAQDSSTGALRGTVEDTGGGRIAAAEISVQNAANGTSRKTISDVEGNFSVQMLTPGEYSVRVDAPGMQAQVRPGVLVELGAETLLQFQMRVAETKETVTVSGQPTLVDTVPSGVSSLLDERAINDLPLNGRRFTDLALLAPGVTQDPRGMTSSSNGDLAFGGVRGYQSSFLVDGADNNNAFFAQARGRYRAPYQFSNEVVQEFRVSSNAYGAELGRAGGAVVNVVTKSGSNHLHGTAFYYLRDSALNAQHPFVDFKPEDRQHQFGFTVGGPIRRNRIFFFGGFDQHAFHVPTVVRFADGSSVVTPQKGQEPLYHGDYEDSDKDIVFAAAAQLTGLAGTHRSALLGSAGVFKLDITLTPKHYLSARMNTSRYWGANNVFFDPSSPITNYAISDNGEESVRTESGVVSLSSALTFHLTSHLRAQFSRDQQESSTNSSDPLTRIYGIIDGFGRSSILPRQTREHRFHLAETISLEGKRHSWKFGGDALLTWINNFFPSLFGGEYIFDDLRVDPWTFAPMTYGMKTTPLRAYAHGVPRYYIQNFGSAVSHPDTNEYSVFAQDTVRLTGRLALSLGLRYDLQTFSKNGLVSNPLWPLSGKVPLDTDNFAPRIGLAYSVGEERPLIVRAGYGWFYTRIPQIYTSAIASDNGIASTHLILDNMDFYDRQFFPSYPHPLASCALNAGSCPVPENIAGRLTTEVSAFSANYRTPHVEQASLNLEKEFAHRMAAGLSFLHVRGQNLLRARDVNLPEPQVVEYPVYDESETNLLGYYNVQTFSQWQLMRSISCPFPPCINPLRRPIPELGAINVFESAASSQYDGLTFSVKRRMTHGLYFRLGYTWAHAVDNGQDALVAGRPATVQNSYAASAEKGSSVTDQRHRFVFSWIAEPQPFAQGQELLGKIFNDWKFAGVVTAGSGRPFEARIVGDPNRDGNSVNDRLPGVGRNAFTGPDYATTDLRISRSFLLGEKTKFELLAESFNLFNRQNQRVTVSDDGFLNAAGQFVGIDKRIGINYFPAYYRRTTDFRRATDAYAPRQIQFAIRFTF